MLSTIQSEKEEHGSLDIETIRNRDVPSYVAGRSYSHLGELAKMCIRDRAFRAAVSEGNTKLAQLLLEKGADIKMCIRDSPNSAS